jgi:hypothetical protein
MMAGVEKVFGSQDVGQLMKRVDLVLRLRPAYIAQLVGWTFERGLCQTGFSAEISRFHVLVRQLLADLDLTPSAMPSAAGEELSTHLPVMDGTYDFADSPSTNPIAAWSADWIKLLSSRSVTEFHLTMAALTNRPSVGRTEVWIVAPKRGSAPALAAAVKSEEDTQANDDSDEAIDDGDTMECDPLRDYLERHTYIHLTDVCAFQDLATNGNDVIMKNIRVQSRWVSRLTAHPWRKSKGAWMRSSSQNGGRLASHIFGNAKSMWQPRLCEQPRSLMISNFISLARYQ